MKTITFKFTDEEADFIETALTTDVPTDLKFEEKFSDHVTQRIINPLLKTGIEINHVQSVRAAIASKSEELNRKTFAEIEIENAADEELK